MTVVDGNGPAPLLTSALDLARAEHKRLRLDFRADWCAPCLPLRRFPHHPDVSAVLKQDYAIATVDLGFSNGGRELTYKLGSIDLKHDTRAPRSLIASSL